MTSTLYTILNAQGHTIADIAITSIEEGWHYGHMVHDHLPDQLRQDCAWYDEVVSGQMLSFLDDATAAMDQYRLTIKAPDGTCQSLHSIHLEPTGDVTWRVTPMSPPRTTSSQSLTAPL